MTETNIIEELADTFGDIYDQCVEHGMQQPFVVCGVGRNGSVVATRVNGDGTTDVLARHIEAGAFGLPIHITIVSQDGRVARVTVEADDAKGEIAVTFH
jgi:hypothetical protein